MESTVNPNVREAEDALTALSAMFQDEEAIPTIHEAVDRFVRAKDAEEKITEMLDRAKALRMTAEQVLVAQMDNSGFQSIARADGQGTVYIRTNVFAGYRKDREKEVFDWLRGIGAGDVIKEGVNYRTLSGIVKEQRENGEIIPDFVTVTEDKKIGLQGRKNRKK